MDNTYKTNRHNLYLFQIIAITNHNTIANVAFGLTSTEVEGGYAWILGQLEEIRSELNIPRPSVVITDKENALKNALRAFFPETQQQLCLYHINANVKGKINSLWRDPDLKTDPKTAAETAGANKSPSPLPTEEEIEALTAPPSSTDPIDEISTCEGLFKEWKALCWAATEEDFDHKWPAIKSTYLPLQKPIIDYL